MKVQRVRVQRSPRSGAVWTQVGPAIAPTDLMGSGTALRDGEVVTVVFGWNEGVPGVWLDDGQAVDLPGQRGHFTPVNELLLLADLRDGPHELDGPNARWRWSLTDAS